MAYLIRYDDETLVEGEWQDAPGWGVQTVVYDDPVDGPTLRHQGDFYRVDETGAVVAMDLMSLLHFVVDELCIVKVGTMCSRTKFDHIYQAAKADQDSLR
jgi:hypothetical protein